jgi:hypothetical protein
MMDPGLRRDDEDGINQRLLGYRNVMYAARGHDCREEVRPLVTGIARVERLAWAGIYGNHGR